MRGLRVAVSLAIAAASIAGVSAAPAQGAQSKPLVAVPSTLLAWSTDAVTLAATGGPAEGKLRFRATEYGCELRPHGVKLRFSLPSGRGTCTVVAIKVGSDGKKLATSEPVIVEFQRRPEIHRAFNGERCTIVGTAGSDILRGTRGDDVICGKGGNDRIIGAAGNDVLDGGVGRDILDGGSGDNLCDYQAGEQKVGTCTYDDAPPEATFSVSPGVVDATAPGAETTLNLRLDDQVGLRRGTVVCRRVSRAYENSAYDTTHEVLARWGFEIGVPGYTSPEDGSFTMWQTDQELPESRYTWSRDRDGMTFQLNLPIGQANASGSVTCSVQAQDRLGRSSSTEFRDAFSVVVDEAPDAPLPQVTSLSLSPSTINMDGSTRRFGAVFTVDAAAGLAHASLMCSKDGYAHGPTGPSATFAFYYSAGEVLPFMDSTPTYGPGGVGTRPRQDGQQYTLSYSHNLSESLPNGAYTCRVTAQDAFGRFTSDSPEQVVELQGTRQRDTEGPSLQSLVMAPGSVDVGRGSQDITVTVQASDPSGVEGVFVACEGAESLRAQWLRQDSGTSLWAAFTGLIGINYRAEYGISGGDLTRPTLSATLTVPFGLAPGTYSCGVSMTDRLGSHSWTPVPNALTVERTWS